MCITVKNANFISTKLQELLVGLKQVLNTEYKRGLFPLIDTLLDERYGNQSFVSNFLIQQFFFFLGLSYF